MPTLSVIMPVYNQKKIYLEEALESILKQTFNDFELIIIDDGSVNQECISILDKYKKLDPRIKLLRNKENEGIVMSLNRGLEESSGEFIARMDSDDISFPERFEKQIDFLRKNEDIDLIGTWAIIIDENGTKIGTVRFPTESILLQRSIIRRNPVLHPTWMFRKSLINSVGKYNPIAINTEDYELLLRIASRHKIANIPEMLLKYRFNTQGISFAKNKIQEKSALKLRVSAILQHGYPKHHFLQIIPPAFIYFFVPSFAKKILLKLSFKHL